MTASERWLRASLHAHGGTVALEGVAETVDYRAFAARAQAAADALQLLGVGPGERVALSSARRGHDEAVALAAILLAGAVAVPLDASAPPLRLETLLDQAGCRAIVHDTALLPVVETLGPLGRLQLDSDGGVQASGGSVRAVAIEPDTSLACILHTSGSTGAPKPVPIQWEGLDTFVDWMIELTQLAKADRVLRVAELSFDLSWFDHIASWRSGATLCTMSRRHCIAGPSLLAQVQRLQPKLIYAVPGLLMRLVAALPPGAALDPSLNVICFAGEVYPPGALAELAARGPAAELFNLYGPTETNVCTYHRVDRAALDGQSELPIGLACPYADCQLIDERGEVICGPGIGELVVRGPTVFAGEHATRDRVYRAEDGLFYFRGRLDRMVKIRGYRVDPSEIEAALAAHPAVAEAAVLSHMHPRLGRTLRAFVTLRHDLPSTDRSLRKHLAERLAPYMLVEVVEVLEELPRTPTGKVDHSALAILDGELPG